MSIRTSLSSQSIQERHSWQRDVRLLAWSRGISMAGTEAGHVALLALAWHLTGSASTATMVLLVGVAVRALSAPLSGWIGDHLDRRRVLICSELIAAAAFGALTVAPNMLSILIAVAIGTLAMCTFGPTIDAVVPNLVPAKHLAAANATLGMARTAGHMLGPVAGGLLVAVAGARSAFAMDAVSSLFGIVLIALVHGDVGGRAASSDSEHDAENNGVFAGMRLVGTDPVLQLLAASWAMMCVGFALITAAELPLAAAFGVGATGYGAIITMWCVGALLGAWAAKRVQVELRGVRVLAICAFVTGIVFVGCGLSPVFTGILALMVAGGATMAMAEVVDTTLLQQRVDDAVRARVGAAFSSVMSIVFGIHLAVGGLIVDTLGPQAAYLLAGAWCVLATGSFLLLARRVREERLAFDLRILRPRHALEAELGALARS